MDGQTSGTGSRLKIMICVDLCVTIGSRSSPHFVTVDGRKNTDFMLAWEDQIENLNLLHAASQLIFCFFVF